jgi:hypothetical protein
MRSVLASKVRYEHPRSVAANSGWIGFFMVICVIMMTTQVFADFCVTTTDVCCDGNPTTGSGATGGELFSTWYVFYDATDACDQVAVSVLVDNLEVWYGILCGCGTTTFQYTIANVHGVKVKVQCERCSSGSCSSCAAGTATVKVYTPSTNACASLCQ